MCNSYAVEMQAQKPTIQSDALFPPQAELLRSGFLDSAANWVICAPTGSGKTLMGEWALLQAVERGRRAVYVAPLKAIVEEKLADWGAKYPNVEIGLFTGETTREPKRAAPKGERILLLTPEKLAGYLSSWKRHHCWIGQIDAVVIDEFHTLGDRHRGASLECLIGRLQRVNPFVRIVALSGTLSNGEEIAGWLKARLFRTEWRPVPIERRIVTFKKITDKYEKLLSEVLKTKEEGGKTLVFVNSRRRSEDLASRLRKEGFIADFNHAGLDQAKRTLTQTDMRQGRLDVVVSTSTLEMGVNFPARKVVIFDSYGFDGESFVPISAQRYLQCAGRAGRAGYDDKGEALIFLPSWARVDIDYLHADPEPVASALFGADRLLAEVLSEVSSRLSISAAHLDANFGARSLWRAQGGARDLGWQVDYLTEAGLLKLEEEGRYLSETSLGRVACQMGLSPQTVVLIRDFFQMHQHIHDFDLLLAACLTRELAPKLGFNFEEIDKMTDAVLDVKSHMLDGQRGEIARIASNLKDKQVLSAIKCAVILHQHTQGSNLAALAADYDCYPADLQALKHNAGWILETAQRIFSLLWRQVLKSEGVVCDEEGEERPESIQEVVCRNLRLMIEHGLPRDCIGLVEIPGIGSVRAHKLVNAGIRNISSFLAAGSARLQEILGLKAPIIGKMIEATGGLAGTSDAECFFDFGAEPAATQADSSGGTTNWRGFGIDPYRLRRALELRVDHVSGEAVRVSGGAEPHLVSVDEDRRGRRTYACDCADFAKGHTLCKHIIRARLELHDDEDILAMLRRLKEDRKKPLRYSLGDLWMNVCGVYDVFNERSVDYSGQRFLDRATGNCR